MLHDKLNLSLESDKVDIKVPVAEGFMEVGYALKVDRVIIEFFHIGTKTLGWTVLRINNQALVKVVS